MLKYINVTQYQGSVSLKGLSFGRKLVRLNHLVPKGMTNCISQMGVTEGISQRFRSHLVCPKY